MLKRKRRRQPEQAAPNLTPMIDVTFQLLIFFILATRFRTPEENHRVQLPRTDGLNDEASAPQEQLTIYCQWDEQAQVNSFVIGAMARARVPVPGSAARLDELVIYPHDSLADALAKRSRYEQLFLGLGQAVEEYIQGSGTHIERIEISFSRDAAQGASSGTVPWMFVSLAIDAAARVNQNRAGRGQEPVMVTFKFADALQRYAGTR